MERGSLMLTKYASKILMSLCVLCITISHTGYAAFSLFAPNQLISRAKIDTLKKNFNGLLNNLMSAEHIQAAQDIIDTINQDASKVHIANAMQHQLYELLKKNNVNPSTAHVVDQQGLEESLVLTRNTVASLKHRIELEVQKKNLTHDTIEILRNTAHLMAQKLMEHQSQALQSMIREKEELINMLQAKLEQEKQQTTALLARLERAEKVTTIARAQSDYITGYPQRLTSFGYGTLIFEAEKKLALHAATSSQVMTSVAAPQATIHEFKK